MNTNGYASLVMARAAVTCDPFIITWAKRAAELYERGETPQMCTLDSSGHPAPTDAAEIVRVHGLEWFNVLPVVHGNPRHD